MSDFGLISEISTEVKDSWFNRTFITIDVDWACDGVLADCIDLLSKSNIKATWFLTHETELIAEIEKNKNFEIGIHPNFNPLLHGDFRNGKNIHEVIERMMQIAPNSRSVRSHSMTQSSGILAAFRSFGLEYDCNHFIPFESGIELRPWRHWTGMQKIPYGWEDDVSLMEHSTFQAKDTLSVCGIKVLDFHPIHLYLNTDDLSLYESARPVLNDCFELSKIKNANFGVRKQFDSFISACI